MQAQRNEADVAWAAGLFEGEGFLSVYQRKYGAKIQPQIGLGMTDRDVVDRFMRIVGCGAIYIAKPGTGGHKQCHCWRLYEAEKVREVVALFLPYFGERRRAKAEELLQRIAGIQSHNSKKTHCPKGHALEGDNLVLEPIKRAGTTYYARRCKVCRQEQARERARKRLGIKPENYRI
jgi:hypothetical protein